jgi:hypothetical protein
MTDSNIFTVSISGDCKVTFSKIGGSDSDCDENDGVTKTIEGNNLFVMSKKSQFVWQDRIDPNNEARAL